MTEVKREYRDRLFSFIFGDENNREWTLSLYNAVNGTSYDDPNDITITTIKEILYLGMHNDVSFLIVNEMNLYEQQSTYNPNMPLRQMQYAGNIYDKYLEDHKMNKYGSRLLALPVPKLVTFYNGKIAEADEKYLHLSDSFPKGAKSDIEVTVRMINVNHGHSRELMELCEPLKEYSWLIQRIRDNCKESEIEDAVNRAINEMPDVFLLKSFLEAHRTEVYGMLLTEYNEAETMELFKAEGREEGLAEGRDTISKLYTKMEKDGRLDDFQKAMRDHSYCDKLLNEYNLIDE